MKNVLFIVYYFPPMGGSGVQRPVKFAKYLRDYGWNPIILRPDVGAYHTYDYSLLKEIEKLNFEIHKVKGNTPLHLAGNKKINVPVFIERALRKISTFFWLPDNKRGWIKPGFEKAIQIIKDNKIDVIYSTAAPYSNLVLAAELKKATGIKTVMDLRDEWLESHLIKYPTPWHRSKMAKIEKETLEYADSITVINDAYKRSFGKRFPGKDIRVINQGFDPNDFQSDIKIDNKTIKLLYSGVFYGRRNPDLFLRAVAEIFEKKPNLKERVLLQFQGGIPSKSLDLIEKLMLKENVQNLGYLDHKESVNNLMNADGLWLVVGHLRYSEYVTLGKMFEYFGSEKPILGLVPEGDSKEMLQKYGPSYIANPFDLEEVKNKLSELFADLDSNSIPAINKEFVNKFDRIKVTEELASLFNEISK